MTDHHQHQSVQHVPITVFASVMGMAGLGLGWAEASHHFALPLWIGHGILLIAGFMFCLLSMTYAFKIMRYKRAILGEWNHPIRSSFFATFSIAFLLLATGAFPHFPKLAEIAWGAGAALQLILTIRIFLKWIENKQEITNAIPAWFIPIVGNIIVPILGVKLGYHDVAWFYFAIGMLFYMPMLSIILHRLFFFDSLPARLFPTIFILIPPAAIGYTSYTGLNGGEDAFARILLNGGLFLTVMVLFQLPKILRQPFAVSWWALTFPLDAITLASLKHSGLSSVSGWAWISGGLLCATSAMVLMVFMKTCYSFAKGELFLAE